MTTVGKPTPSQEEQDAHARGERPTEHEHDGSTELVGAQKAENVQEHVLHHHVGKHEGPSGGEQNPDHPIGLNLPEGWNYIPPEGSPERVKFDEDAKKKSESDEANKQKSAESEGGAGAAYKTRESHPDKRGKAKDK